MKMKKHNLVTLLLLIYTAVMAYIGWERHIPQGDYWQYIAIICASLLVTFLLRYVLIKKEKLRQGRNTKK